MATKTIAPRVMTGGEAAAEAMRQIDPDVVPVYPITPQTPIIQGFAKFVANGRAHGEIINVESEHSAMSAAIGSALAGARTITATSSQGLALMAEIVYIAASMRAPIVMALGNRALSGPINIHCDHSDSMLVRDSGVIQLFAENAQEAYDLMVMAPRIAEHPDVLLPVFVCQDGFTITHSAEPVLLLGDRSVQRFVGTYRIPHPLLDVQAPTSQGPFAMPDYYFEVRYQQVAAMAAALPVLDEIFASFERISGRCYDVVEAYELGRCRPRDRLSGFHGRDREGRGRRVACPRRARRSAPDPIVPTDSSRPNPSGAGIDSERGGARPCRLAGWPAAAVRGALRCSRRNVPQRS